jgi:signal transduction histidine kinase
MKLQLRFLLVLATIFFVSVSFLLMQQKFDLDRSKSVLASELQQRKSYLQNIVGLDGRSEQSFVEDYSFWDDMVTFVKTNDVNFAHENLDTGLSTFGADADWVYRPSGTQIYFSSADNTNTLKNINLSAAFFSSLVKTKFAHFYIYDHGQLIEVRAATIVPSNDPNHSTPAKGYLLVGRILGKDYAHSISLLTSSTVEIAPASETKNVTTTNTVAFGEPLRNWNGQPTAALRSTSTVSVISNLKQQRDRQLVLLSVFTAVSVAIVVMMLWWLVLRPLSTIIRAIKQQQPEQLEHISRHKTEFGRLAQTVIEFYQQKISLSQAEFKQTELEKLNKEKASFLAIAAHELNGPVANVKLFAEYLSFLLTKGGNKADVDKQVHRIEHQTTKINMLLNDLRAASTGKPDLSFNRRDIDFDSFLKEEVEEASFSIKNKLNLFCDTHATINSDPDRLGQVVTNLIRNAMKYSPNAGDILIHGKLHGDKIVVSVQDFGVGVSPEDIPHLFQRFYRSARVATAFPGLGLGLYVSKGIIEALGGTMWVESQLEKGSTFYFSLPVKAVAVTDKPSAPAPPQSPVSPAPAAAAPSARAYHERPAAHDDKPATTN